MRGPKGRVILMIGFRRRNGRDLGYQSRELAPEMSVVPQGKSIKAGYSRVRSLWETKWVALLMINKTNLAFLSIKKIDRNSFKKISSLASSVSLRSNCLNKSVKIHVIIRLKGQIYHRVTPLALKLSSQASWNQRSNQWLRINLIRIIIVAIITKMKALHAPFPETKVQ